ncbi:ANTAR domain-containing protein [Geodermatophilus normandii]|uniref:GAF and ANTAR domain-containing protein n=1 Tax=Geodermatophilus normandii TaxID=1137989 RepID=A0A6P0G912_9ACTN|nr:GAF and ANTAR domain-containing protein [Geodermatophilus normandii]
MTRLDDDRFSAALLDLGLVPGAAQSPDDVLSRVAELADAALGHTPALSVTVVRDDGTPATAAASARVAADLDVVQYRLGSGPCLEAATRSRVVVVEDTGRPDQWPELSEQAAAQDRRSIVSTPFPTARPVVGGLNLYLSRALAGDAPARERATVFARHAVVPVAGALAHALTARHAEDLQTALRSRAVIDQAKGILMERFRLTADQAFDALARVSNQTNTKVRDVAVQLVDTGEFPPV